MKPRLALPLWFKTLSLALAAASVTAGAWGEEVVRLSASEVMACNRIVDAIGSAWLPRQ